jgi:hypothetical protein
MTSIGFTRRNGSGESGNSLLSPFPSLVRRYASAIPIAIALFLVNSLAMAVWVRLGAPAVAFDWPLMTFSGAYTLLILAPLILRDKFAAP